MMNLQGSLSGFTEWEARDASGGVVQSGARHNLITDVGLDAFASESAEPFSAFRSALQVGTGSGTPTPSKLTLTNKVAANNTNGGFSAEEGITYAVAGGMLTGSYKIVRVVDFTASYNLTEYGLSNNITGNLNITELFRDASNNPVTVSVQAGYQLKLTHTLNVSLPFNPVSAVLNLGTGNISVNTTFYANAPGQYSNCFAVFAPGSSCQLYGITAADAGSATVTPANTSVPSTPSLSVYVAGAYQRVKNAVVEPANGNISYAGFMFTRGTNINGAFKCAFQGGATITKNNTQRLSLNFTVSWARA